MLKFVQKDDSFGHRPISLWLTVVRAFMFYVYFIKSASNGKVYVGQTTKMPKERLREHNIGTNNWTKVNGPFTLLYYEEYVCREDAIRRERFYKSGLGREIKQAIIRALTTDD